MGVDALFFITHAQEYLKENVSAVSNETLKFLHMVVLCSVILYGITAPIVHVSLRKRRRRDDEMYNTESEYTEIESDCFKE